MKALIISGSERSNGVTATVSETTKSLLYQLGVESEIISLCAMSYTPCNSCGNDDSDCNYRETPCEKEDDIPKIVQKMINSNIIIFACPVHAFGMPHLMQIFLERAGVGYLRFKRPLINKIGGIIVVGRKYNLGTVHDQLLNNMLLNRMIVPGPGFPVLIHGDEKTKNIIDIEEKVSLNQMLQRLQEVATSLKSGALPDERDNERMIKEKYIENTGK